jgi:hypothetical protein
MGEHRPPRGLWLLLGLVLFGVGTVPYLYAQRSCPEAIFGGVLGNWHDTRQHLAYINHYQHALLIPNVFSTEAHRPFLLGLEFNLGGLFAKMLGGRLVLAWHILRLLSLLAFTWAVVRATYRFVPSGRRGIALALALAPPILSLLPDFSRALEFLRGGSSIAGNTICYAFEQPQQSLAAALVVLAVLGIDRFGEQAGARVPWSAALAVLGIWLVHPFEFWSVGFVFAAVVLYAWRKRELVPGGLLRAGIGAGAMAAPVLLYVAIDRWSGGGYTRQSAIYGNNWPGPLDLVLTLGVAGIVAGLVAAGVLSAPRDRAHRLLVIWLCATVVAIYAPLAPWRWHQVNGLQVCIALLAARATFWERLVTSSGRRAAALAAMVSLAMLLQWPYLRELQTQASNCGSPAFYAPGTAHALDYLHANARPGDQVLARPMRGLDVAMYSEARPYVAGRKKTIDWERKTVLADGLLSGSIEPGELARVFQGARTSFILCEDKGDVLCDDTRLASSFHRVIAEGEVRLLASGRD